MAGNGKFKLNKEIAKIFSFTCSPYNAPVFAGKRTISNAEVPLPRLPYSPWLAALQKYH